MTLRPFQRPTRPADTPNQLQNLEKGLQALHLIDKIASPASAVEVKINEILDALRRLTVGG